MLANYSNSVWYGLASDCNCIWGITTSEFLVFVSISFVAVAKDKVLWSKKASPSILSKCYGVLTALKGRLVGLLEEFPEESCFYEIVRGMTFDPVFPYFAFRW